MQHEVRHTIYTTPTEVPSSALAYAQLYTSTAECVQKGTQTLTITGVNLPTPSAIDHSSHGTHLQVLHSRAVPEALTQDSPTQFRCRQYPGVWPVLARRNHRVRVRRDSVQLPPARLLRRHDQRIVRLPERLRDGLRRLPVVRRV
jgi:hypothetical protein